MNWKGEIMLFVGFVVLVVWGAVTLLNDRVDHIEPNVQAVINAPKSGDEIIVTGIDSANELLRKGWEVKYATARGVYTYWALVYKPERAK